MGTYSIEEVRGRRSKRPCGVVQRLVEGCGRGEKQASEKEGRKGRMERVTNLMLELLPAIRVHALPPPVLNPELARLNALQENKNRTAPSVSFRLPKVQQSKRKPQRTCSPVLGSVKIALAT